MVALTMLRGVDSRDLDLSEVGSWPGPMKALCFALAAALALLLAYVFALSGQRVELAAAEHRERGLQGQLATKQSQAAGLAGAHLEREQAEADLAALLRRLPDQAEVPGLLEDISDAAAANDLAIERIELAQERPAGVRQRPDVSETPYVELPIAIVVRGGYHQLGTFVAAIAALERLVTLHDFALATREEDDGLVLSVTAKTYRHLDDLGEHPPTTRQGFAPPAPAAYVSADRRSPFKAAAAIPDGSVAPPDSQRSKTPLERFALGELHMVGTLAGRATTRALVRDPEGRIHALRVGDYLGMDHGRIAAVHPASVEVIETVNQGRHWLQRPRALALVAAHKEDARNDP